MTSHRKSPARPLAALLFSACMAAFSGTVAAEPLNLTTSIEKPAAANWTAFKMAGYWRSVGGKTPASYRVVTGSDGRLIASGHHGSLDASATFIFREGGYQDGILADWISNRDKSKTGVALFKLTPEGRLQVTALSGDPLVQNSGALERNPVLAGYWQAYLGMYAGDWQTPWGLLKLRGEGPVLAGAIMRRGPAGDLVERERFALTPFPATANAAPTRLIGSWEAGTAPETKTGGWAVLDLGEDLKSFSGWVNNTYGSGKTPFAGSKTAHPPSPVQRIRGSPAPREGYVPCPVEACEVKVLAITPVAVPASRGFKVAVHVDLAFHSTETTFNHAVAMRSIYGPSITGEGYRWPATNTYKVAFSNGGDDFATSTGPYVIGADNQRVEGWLYLEPGEEIHVRYAMPEFKGDSERIWLAYVQGYINRELPVDPEWICRVIAMQQQLLRDGKLAGEPAPIPQRCGGAPAETPPAQTPPAEPVSQPVTPAEPATSAPAPIAPPATTPPAGTVATRGVFHSLGEFDVRLDQATVANDGKVHALLTLRNPSDKDRTVFTGSIKAVLRDADGLGVGENRVYRPDADPPAAFATDNPVIPAQGELKVRMVVQPFAGHSPLQRLTIRNERQTKALAFDVSGLGTDVQASGSAPSAGGGAFKALSKLDVRVDAVTAARDGGSEVFLTLRNPKDVPEDVGRNWIKLSFVGPDGAKITSLGDVWPVRGERNKALYAIAKVEPGQETRLRFAFKGVPVNGALTVSDGKVAQVFTAGAQ